MGSWVAGGRGQTSQSDFGHANLLQLKIFHSEPLHRMCGLNKGVVNHVGAIGLHSKPNKYDRDAHFEKRNKEMK